MNKQFKNEAVLNAVMISIWLKYNFTALTFWKTSAFSIF